jgi:hypothetical protein
MAKSSKKGQLVKRAQDSESYSAVPNEITEILQSARRATARAVNTVIETEALRGCWDVTEADGAGSVRRQKKMVKMVALASGDGRRGAEGMSRRKA